MLFRSHHGLAAAGKNDNSCNDKGYDQKGGNDQLKLFVQAEEFGGIAGFFGHIYLHAQTKKSNIKFL